MKSSTRRKLLTTVAAAPVAVAAAQPASGRVKQAHYTGAKPSGTPLYSTAISYGDLVFISGHGVADKGGVKVQTAKVLDQIAKGLESAGSSMEKVLKCNVYLQDIGDYKAMNEVYLGRFGSTPPVRTTIAAAAIPLDGCLVEIDVIAHR